LVDLFELYDDARTCECQFHLRTYIVFTIPIFTELTNAQQHHVQISYNEFQPNRKNLESAGTNSFASLRKLWLPLKGSRN